MANEEHKRLAQFLKEVHSSLRNSASKVGAQQAWLSHCENKHVLQTYARCMEKLATTHWEQNYANESSCATSRINWTASLCNDYFLNKSYIQYRKKEINIASKINVALNKEESFSTPIKLLDVGSCYNPFKIFDFLDVLAIDLCPANSSVLECDFLDVPIGSSTEIESHKLKQLGECIFDVVTFCFLLEYIPTSELRVSACQKAYTILKPGGLLIIITPDSKHVGANSKIMKSWQYTLANVGFMRIKYEKLRHMHCMVFRKTLHKCVTVRWATLHRKPYMDNSISIPQDFHNCNDDKEYLMTEKMEISTEDFKELPFCNILE